MAIRMNRRMFWPLGLAAALLVGCGGAPTATHGPGAPEQPDETSPRGLLQQNGDPARVAPDHGSRFMATLALTPGQKARLKEIKADWPKVDKARLAGMSEEFKLLLRAEPINQGALESLMTSVFERVNATAARRVGLVEKARGVLTESQRQQIAVVVLAHLGVHGDRAPADSDLGLTAEQKAAFAWTQKMTKARRMAALSSFLLTGDRAALTAAWTVQVTASDIARMADVLVSLTPAQREKLIASMERAHAAMGAEREAME